jgi:hypothetical protein
VLFALISVGWCHGQNFPIAAIITASALRRLENVNRRGAVRWRIRGVMMYARASRENPAQELAPGQRQSPNPSIRRITQPHWKVTPGPDLQRRLKPRRQLSSCISAGRRAQVE